MVSERFIQQHGYLVDGHEIGLRDARVMAYTYLTDHGVSPFEADKLTDQAGVDHAWWLDEAGFVGEAHPDGTPVTIVHIRETVPGLT